MLARAPATTNFVEIVGVGRYARRTLTNVPVEWGHHKTMRKLSIPIFYLFGVATPLFLLVDALAQVAPSQRWTALPLLILLVGLAILPLRQGRSRIAWNCWGGLIGGLAGIGLGLVALVLLFVWVMKEPSEFAVLVPIMGGLVVGAVAGPLLGVAGVFAMRLTRGPGEQWPEGASRYLKELLDAAVLSIAVGGAAFFAYRVYRGEIGEAKSVDALILAVGEGRTDKVVPLIEEDPGIVHLVELLLASGADPNLGSQDGETAFHLLQVLARRHDLRPAARSGSSSVCCGEFMPPRQTCPVVRSRRLSPRHIRSCPSSSMVVVSSRTEGEPAQQRREPALFRRMDDA